MNLSGLKSGGRPRPGVEDSDYVEFISKIGSLIDGRFDRRETVSGVIFRTEGHHIHTRGARGGDYWRIPLTHEQHMLCHSRGNHFVERKYKLDFHNWVCKLLAKYFDFEIIDTGDWESTARQMVLMAEDMYRSKNG